MQIVFLRLDAKSCVSLLFLLGISFRDPTADKAGHSCLEAGKGKTV